jgi:hypothetical protein
MSKSPHTGSSVSHQYEMQLLLQLLTTRPEDVLYQLVQPLVQAMPSNSACVRASNASAALAFTLQHNTTTDRRLGSRERAWHTTKRQPDRFSTTKQHAGQDLVNVVHLALNHKPGAQQPQPVIIAGAIHNSCTNGREGLQDGIVAEVSVGPIREKQLQPCTPVMRENQRNSRDMPVTRTLGKSGTIMP